MNIIKVENVKGFFGSTHKVEVRTGYKKNGESTFSTIVVLDGEDIENDNTIVKLKTHNIDCLLIPKKYKFTFNETKCFKWITPYLVKDFTISYF